MTEKQISYILILILLSGCIEVFDPPSRGYENLLVVEGYLSDRMNGTEVKLSRSVPLDTIARLPETGASISIADATGEEFRMVENKDGIYHFHNDINARIGETYQLRITTSNGKRYVSDWVTLRETPPIDTVIWRYEERPDIGLKGVQIYLNTNDPENDTWYYRWFWEETWQFHTAYRSDIYWTGDTILPRKEQVYTCWKNTHSTTIQVFSSKILDQDVVYNYPLLYIGNNTDRLRIRYSLNVKQYALSEESFNYWQELDMVTENLGTLFDPLPTTLNSNIHNVSNENETVLGYFDAATVEEKRIFIDYFDLPYMRYKNYYEDCQDSIVFYGGIAEMVLSGYELAKGLVRTTIREYRMSSPFCIDCTIAGTNVKPDFW